VRTDEAHAAAEHEQPVERTDVDVLDRLLAREDARAAQQVHERHADHAVHVQDQVRLLNRPTPMSERREGGGEQPRTLDVVTFSTSSA